MCRAKYHGGRRCPLDPAISSQRFKEWYKENGHKHNNTRKQKHRFRKDIIEQSTDELNQQISDKLAAYATFKEESGSTVSRGLYLHQQYREEGRHYELLTGNEDGTPELSARLKMDTHKDEEARKLQHRLSLSPYSVFGGIRDYAEVLSNTSFEGLHSNAKDHELFNDDSGLYTFEELVILSREKYSREVKNMDDGTLEALTAACEYEEYHTYGGLAPIEKVSEPNTVFLTAKDLRVICDRELADRGKERPKGERFIEAVKEDLTDEELSTLKQNMGLEETPEAIEEITVENSENTSDSETTICGNNPSAYRYSKRGGGCRCEGCKEAKSVQRKGERQRAKERREKETARYVASENAKTSINHGTIEGYEAHRKLKVPVCFACMEAKRTNVGDAISHGTVSGYRAELRYGMKTCESCKKANAAYEKERISRKKATVK